MENHELLQVDTTVVGGGLAGLTAAAYLARAGKKVVVLEKAKQIGGRAMTKQRGQFLFNLGPHALYIGGGGSQVLEELHVNWTGARPAVSGAAVYQGKTYRLPVLPQDMLRTKLFTIREKAAFLRILTRAMRTEPATVAELSVGEWINQQTDSPVLRQALQAVVRVATYSNAPEQLSADVFFTQMQLSEGVRYLDGGWQTLVDGLYNVAESAGVTILTGVRVMTVHDQPTHTTISLVNGQTIQAQTTILAVDPKTASHLLPENTQLNRWAQTAVPVRAAVLDVALRRLPNLDGNFALGIDEPTYLSNHTLYARLGPEGEHLLHVAKYLPTTPTDSAQDEADLEALLDLMQPGWRAEVIEQRFLPNMVVVNWLALAGDGGLNGRPGYAVPDSHNLYLAGDWVGPHGWLADASFVSGKKAAELILMQRIENRELEMPNLQSPISNLNPV